jgi:hypothetical protein
LVHFAKCVYMNSLHTDHDQVQRALTQTHAQLKHWMWSLTAHICTRTHWPCMVVYNIRITSASDFRHNHAHIYTDHARLSTTSVSHCRHSHAHIYTDHARLSTTSVSHCRHSLAHVLHVTRRPHVLT